MTTRLANTRAKAVLLIAAIGGGASPVLADCCDSVLGCAATIVTYGVSCEIETIISTIKNLINAIDNVVNLATGTTNSAVKAARDWFNTTHDYLQSQSQQGAANLTAAAAQAQAIYKQETMILPMTNLAGVHSAGMTSTGASSNPPTASKPQTQQLAVRQSMTPASGPAPAPPAGNFLEKSIQGPAKNVVTLQSTLPPHGDFGEDFSIAVKQIAALQSASASDLPTVTQYLQQAVQTEGAGELTAQSIASNAINAPLNSIKNVLSSMLSNPTQAFDPSAQVQTVEDSVMSQLNTNVGKMVDNVVDGPNTAFKALGPSFGRLMTCAQEAQAIAAAMDRMYKERTPATVAALHALLPKANLLQNDKATAQASLNVKYANGVSYTDLLNQSRAMRLKATTAVNANVQQFHTLATTLKAQIVQGKQAQTPSMLQTYQGKLSQQLSSAFDGKSASAVNSQRDQLIAQARTRYSQDPKTQNAVIALLNSEAAKRTGNASASASASTLARPVPAVATQATSLVPSAAPVSQAKATAWGSAPPAWAPPGTAVKTPAVPVPGVQPVATGATLPGMKMVQPVKPPPAVRQAPSSLTNP